MARCVAKFHGVTPSSAKVISAYMLNFKPIFYPLWKNLQEIPEILDVILKIQSTTDHGAKFRTMQNLVSQDSVSVVLKYYEIKLQLWPHLDHAGQVTD